MRTIYVSGPETIPTCGVTVTKGVILFGVWTGSSNQKHREGSLRLQDTTLIFFYKYE